VFSRLTESEISEKLNFRLARKYIRIKLKTSVMVGDYYHMNLRLDINPIYSLVTIEFQIYA